MKKGTPLILSILIHAAVISLFLFISVDHIIKHYSDKEITDVSIEGDPNKKIGNGNTSRMSQKNIGNNMFIDTPDTKNTINNVNSGGNPGSGEGGGTGLWVKNNYMGLVLKSIHSHKYYPIYAKKKGLTGIVKLKFTLKKNGSIQGNIEKLNSSGSDLLDNAGIKAIKDSAPFPVFPAEITDQEINFIVDIDFVL